jgi:hypothetical protein
VSSFQNFRTAAEADYVEEREEDDQHMVQDGSGEYTRKARARAGGERAERKAARGEEPHAELEGGSDVTVRE